MTNHVGDYLDILSDRHFLKRRPSNAIVLVLLLVLSGLVLVNLATTTSAELNVHLFFTTLLVFLTLSGILIYRFPPLLFHLFFIAVALDEWGSLSAVPIPFFSLSKAAFLLGSLVLLLRFFSGFLTNNQIRIPKPVLYHIPFSLVCLISALLFSNDLSYSFRMLQSVIFLPIVCLVLYQFTGDKHNLPRLTKVFVWYSFLPVLIALGEIYTPFFTRPGDQHYGVKDIFRVSGSYGNPNDFAILLLFSLCLIFAHGLISKRWPTRFLWMLAFLVQSLVLLRTYSRSGYLTVGMAFVFLAVLGKHQVRRLAWVLCACAVILMIAHAPTRDRLQTLAGMRAQVQGASQAHYSLNIRKALLDHGVSQFNKNKLLGIGFSNLPATMPKTHVSLARRVTVENTYLEVLIETGLLGLFCYLFFLLMTIAAGRKVLTSTKDPNSKEYPITICLAAAFIAFLFNGLFDTNLDENLPWILLPLFLCVADPERGHL